MINIFSRYSSYRFRLPYFTKNMVHNNWLLFLIYNFSLSSIYNFNYLIIASTEFRNNLSTPHWYNWYSKVWSLSFQEFLCEPSLLSMCDRVLPIIASSIKVGVYKIFCFSEMSLPGSDLFLGFIILTSPHERSADPIPSIFEVAL